MTSNQIAAQRNKIEQERIEREDRARHKDLDRKEREFQQKKKGDRREKREAAYKRAKDITRFVGEMAPLLTNHPEWYSKFPGLLESAGKISTGYPTGVRLTEREISNVGIVANGSIAAIGNAFPGIAALHYTPSLGVSLDANSALNIAMRRLYTFVRHANSGSRNYDAPDLMIYSQAVSSLIEYIAELTRVYGALNYYNSLNLYTGKAMVTALGFDYEDLSTHMADLLAFINLLTVKAQQFAVPNDFALTMRRCWLNSNVFIESDNPKDQMYVLVPEGHFKFTLDGDGAGALVLSSLHNYLEDRENQRTTFAQIVQFGNQLINAIVGNEDFGIMAGDILKAYGDSVYQLSALNADYVLKPQYDTKALDMIRNAVPVGSAVEMNDLSNIIVQDENKAWLFTPGAFIVPSQSYLYGGANIVLDTDVPDPDPAYIASITSLSTIPKNFSESEANANITMFTCGSEVVLGVRLYTWAYANSTDPASNAYLTTSVWYRAKDPLPSGTYFEAVQNATKQIEDTTSQWTDPRVFIEGFRNVMKFRYFPQILLPMVTSWNDDDANFGGSAISIAHLASAKNSFVIPRETLAGVHNAILTSMLASQRAIVG